MRLLQFLVFLLLYADGARFTFLGLGVARVEIAIPWLTAWMECPQLAQKFVMTKPPLLSWRLLL